MAVMPCKSDVCKLESKRFLDIMDAEVDPCEDFYQFVCGKFHKDDKYPENFGISWTWARKQGE